MWLIHPCLLWSTVGAGILALPAVTISSGFIPSSLTLIMAWIVSGQTIKFIVAALLLEKKLLTKLLAVMR